MFAPITQKFQFRHAVLSAAVFTALFMSACTSTTIDAIPAPDSKSEQVDHCANLPGVTTVQDMIEGELMNVSVEGKGMICLPAKEAQALINEQFAEQDKRHQEAVAQATQLVLGSQPAENTTAVDKTTKAVAYYCNHVGDKAAEEAARLVYNANYVPILPPVQAPTPVEIPQEAGIDNGFSAVTSLVCGHLQTEDYIAPVESPSVTTFDS